jgi:hypothetical protein
MVHSDSLKDMPTKWIYKVDIMLVIYSKFFYLSLFDVSYDSRSNSFEEKDDEVIQDTKSNDLF